MQAHRGHGIGSNIYCADYGATQALSASVVSDPDFALGHAGLARAINLAGQMPEARAAISCAEVLARSSSDRERGHVAAFSVLFTGNPGQARVTVKS